jgi:N-acetylglucosamine kinase-like BadF-type ATPase
MDIKELGLRIKNYRIATGFTQAELADILHLVPQTVSKWERGLSAPDITKLSSLCSALGISASLLLDGSELSGEEYMIAIDGGGTKTECVLFKSSGEVVMRTFSGGSNPNVKGMSQACEALREAVDKCMERGVPVRYIYAGIAGSSVGNNRRELAEFLKKQYPGCRVCVESDIMNVIGLAEDNSRSVAGIIGTGFVAFGWDGKQLYRKGGLGYMFDGAGSGYDIGREVISRTLAYEEGFLPFCEIARLTQIKLGGRASDALAAIYAGGVDYVAAFASLAFDAIELGDRDAEQIINKSAKKVAECVNALRRERALGDTVVISGGIARSLPLMQKKLREYIGAGACVEFPELPPIFGAMRRALDLSGAEYDFDSLQEKFKLSIRGE